MKQVLKTNCHRISHLNDYLYCGLLIILFQFQKHHILNFIKFCLHKKREKLVLRPLSFVFYWANWVIYIILKNILRKISTNTTRKFLLPKLQQKLLKTKPDIDLIIFRKILVPYFLFAFRIRSTYKVYIFVCITDMKLYRITT